MKELKIEVPKGYVIDQENSDLANGVVKFKEQECRVPKSVDDLFEDDGVIEQMVFSSPEQCEAFKAFSYIRRLYNATGQSFNVRPHTFTIESFDRTMTMNLFFESDNLMREFKKVHKDLIEKVKGI